MLCSRVGCTQKAYPEYWAKLQILRGIIWQTTPTGDHAENLQKAKDAFLDALQVFTLQAYPFEGAWVQSTLGNVWLKLRSGDIEQSQRNAIKAFKAALTVFTQETYPVYYGSSQYGLGNAWRGRAFLPWGGQDDFAINAYQEALKVYTRQSNPAYWAEMQMYLASRVTLDKSDKEKSCNSMKQVIMRIRAVEKLNLTTGWKDWWVKYIRSQWIEFLCGNDASFDAIPPLE